MSVTNALNGQRIRSRSTINRDNSAGLLPAYRLGGRLFIRKADVLALVKPGPRRIMTGQRGSHRPRRGRHGRWHYGPS